MPRIADHSIGKAIYERIKDYDIVSRKVFLIVILQITITANGVQLCNINDYNLLYSTLYDLEGADFSQTSKRFLENADPSVYFTTDTTSITGGTNIKAAYGTDGTAAATSNVETSRPFVINNFLGFINSLSTPVLDLNDIGDVYIEIRWASPAVLWAQ